MSNRDKRLKRRVRWSYVISTVSIALVLFMLGSVSYVMMSALSASRSLRENVVLSVELADSLFSNEKQAVYDRIVSRREVADVEYMAKQDKINDEEFRRVFASQIDELLQQNPLRDSYEVSLSADHASEQDVEAFIADISSATGVEYVAVPPISVIETMQTTVRHISWSLVIFLAVLLFISILLLNNTIRLAIYAKRYLINTMKLVGATKWYIMRPLLCSALRQGILAGAGAGILMCVALYGVERFTPAGIRMLPHEEVAAIIGAMMVVGVVISVAFSALAINKFVNMKSNKIHLY